MDQAELEKQVILVCRGNGQAIAFLDDITTILHLWDDLVDKNKALPDKEINSGMWKALIDLPRNQFYAANFVTLNTLLMNAILNWECATEMERSPQDATDEVIAFIIRSCYLDLVTMTALLCGGADHARAMLPTIRRIWHDEGLDGYRKNLAEEYRARST
jgi:hypothetical protein